MKILFVCKYNRFRSKIAEAIFNKLNKNKHHKAISAGIIRGSPISPPIIHAAKMAGYPIRGKPQGLSADLLKWHDTAIIVADDVPLEIFKDNKKYGHKTIVWKIPDTTSDKSEEMQKIIIQIEREIISLIKKLK